MSLSKVKVEKTTLPVARFDWSHDTLTTFDWGEVQPVHTKLLPVAGMKSKLSCDFQVRLAPMPSPTFGRIFLKLYHQFVPMTDIFKQFPHFLAQVERLNNVGNNMKRVQRLPTITTDVLMYYLCQRSFAHTWYYYRGGNGTITNDWQPSTTQETSDNQWNVIFRGLGSSPVNFHFGYGGAYDVNNADYIYNPAEADFRAVGASSSSVDVTFTSRLTRKGLRLYKAITGAGLKPSFDTNVEVSALPLFAVYKAYFDVFHLPQVDNYEGTALYRLIRYYDVNGTDHVFSLANDTQSWMPTLKLLWDAFFEELANMWYTANCDFVSSHLPYDISAADSKMSDLLNVDEISTITSYNGASGSHTTAALNNASLTGDTSYWLNQLDDEYARKLYYYINRKSQVGYDLRKLLLLRGYGEYVNDVESKYLGKSTTQIVVSQLLSTSDTSAAGGKELGDYAGQSSVFDSKSPVIFENKQIGYQISLAVIVPETRMSNALDGSSLGVTPTSFYSGLFDGFGMSATPRLCIGYDDRVVYTRPNTGEIGNTIFGIKPRFMEYKVANSIRNGCFLLQSQRDTWNSWHLDRLIYQHENETVQTSPFDATTQKWKDKVNPSSLPLDNMPDAQSEWRYPTKFGFLGHYDRIFYDGQFSFDMTFDRNDELYPTDNFMCQMVINNFVSGRMLPVSKTWETIECEDDTKAQTFTITK